MCVRVHVEMRKRKCAAILQPMNMYEDAIILIKRVYVLPQIQRLPLYFILKLAPTTLLITAFSNNVRWICRVKNYLNPLTKHAWQWWRWMSRREDSTRHPPYGGCECGVKKKKKKDREENSTLIYSSRFPGEQARVPSEYHELEKLLLVIYKYK